MHLSTWRRRIAAVLIIPFLLVLAGCGRLHADFTIKSADEINLKMDIGIQEDFLEEMGSPYSSAQEMCDEMAEDTSQGDFWGDVTPKAYEEDGIWGCRGEGVVKREDFGSGFSLKEADGKYHLKITSSGETDPSTLGTDMSDFDFQVTFAFPGKVEESKGGKIDGKTVTYTDMDDFNKGVDITAKAGGFPWLIVILVVLVLGFLLLVAVAIGAFLFIRSRKGKSGSTGGSGSSVPYGAGASAASAPGQQPQGAASPYPGQSSPAAPQQSGQGWGGQGSPAAPQQGTQGWGQAPGQGTQPPTQGGQQSWGQAPGQGTQPPAQGGQQGWGQPPHQG